MSSNFRNVRVVGLRDKKEIITLPPLERTVLVNGREVIKEVPLQTVVIERGSYHVPRSENELEALKSSAMHGKIYRVVEQEAEEPEEEPDEDEQPPAPPEEPKTADGSVQISDALEGITTKAEAAEVLMNEPFSVDKELLLSDAGNLTKSNIKDAAEQFGVSFPNL